MHEGHNTQAAKQRFACLVIHPPKPRVNLCVCVCVCVFECVCVCCVAKPKSKLPLQSSSFSVGHFSLPRWGATEKSIVLKTNGNGSPCFGACLAHTHRSHTRPPTFPPSTNTSAQASTPSSEQTKMGYCEYCGHEDAGRYCARCGRPQQDNPPRPGDAFCC